MPIPPMRTVWAALFGLATLSAHAADYGAAIPAQEPIELDAAIAQLGQQPTADVVVKSTVEKVCLERGCWLALKSAGGDIHVTFKNESFYVPASLVGKTVVVAGRLQKIGTADDLRYEFVATGLDVV